MTPFNSNNPPPDLTRRKLLDLLIASPLLLTMMGAASKSRPLSRAIPSSGEHIPLVGLGSWISFNVGNDPVARAASAEVMRHFFRRVVA
jgi:hypothetical protein